MKDVLLQTINKVLETKKFRTGDIPFKTEDGKEVVVPVISYDCRGLYKLIFFNTLTGVNEDGIPEFSKDKITVDLGRKDKEKNQHVTILNGIVDVDEALVVKVLEAISKANEDKQVKQQAYLGEVFKLLNDDLDGVAIVQPKPRQPKPAFKKPFNKQQRGFKKPFTKKPYNNKRG